jgi:hypothetical protein
LASQDAIEVAHAVDAFLQRFGEDSCHQAAIRAQELEVRGDKEGARLWRKIETELRIKLAGH